VPFLIRLSLYGLITGVSAFVLINAEVGSEEQVVKKLRETDNVKEAHLVYGVYDLIAKVEAEAMDKLKDVIAQKVRRVTGIRSTLTLLVQ